MTFCICRIQYTHKNLYISPNTEIKETNRMKQLNYQSNVEENLAGFLINFAGAKDKKQNS